MSTEMPGSAKTLPPDTRIIADAPADERLEVTLRLRPRCVLDWRGERLTQLEYLDQHGPNATDIADTRRFAAENSLAIEVDEIRRTAILSGTVRQVRKAFSVDLMECASPRGIYRGRQGPIYLPGALQGSVEAVFGLDNRPQCRPYMVSRAGAGGFYPSLIAQMYNFPAGLDGSGQTVGVLCLGGGARPQDITAYFQKIGLPVPVVKVVSVDHATNRPGSDADSEVMLDLQVIGCVAPRATIILYFAPNTDAGFLNAITTAIHDATNKPSVFSISWGAPEEQWTPQAMQQMEQAFQTAAALGVTITAAAGDDGSNDGVRDGKPHVDFPAASPSVLACGGTRINVSNGKITSEVVWGGVAGNGATGGGYSNMFSKPNYQSTVPGQKRMVPDVAGNADPASGYVIQVNGRLGVIGGTSAVAPLWAGLTALFNQALGKWIGFLNPILYGLPAGVMRDITQGSNGQFQAGPGPDPCTGLGVPDGAKLLQFIQGGVVTPPPPPPPLPPPPPPPAAVPVLKIPQGGLEAGEYVLVKRF